MSYLDLGTDNVLTYIRKHGVFFSEGAKLSVREIDRNEVDGDGYVNHIFRVWDEGGNSVIVKQAKPYLKIFGEGVFPLPVARSASETDIIEIRSAIVPKYVPKLIHVDRGNNLFISEDCGKLGIMRFGLSRGRRYPRFPRMMGEFIAKCNFYTSELYLDQGVHKELGRRFVSPEMSRIMETILFFRKSVLDDLIAERETPDPTHASLSDIFWDKRDVQAELLKLRDIYMKKQECLVHGDLHTSNTMINEDRMKIIDMEYTHMGPYSSDSGYLLGNLVYTYDTWFYHEEWTEEARAGYRDEVLGYISETLKEYIRCFSWCWESAVKDFFRPFPEYLENLFADYLREVCGFMGSQICSRVGSLAETFDFDVLPDLKARNAARALALATAYNLIMRRGDVKSPDDITDIVRGTAEIFRGATRQSSNISLITTPRTVSSIPEHA
ncbi:MAG: phosphotransferase [Synergistaceae bacterium]|jgi:5-methylthioribose kinase|nr:phosphotransferase [Synergistaceae bacterium]